MAGKRVRNPKKLKTDLAITIHPLTLCWVEAESLYKTVIKLEVKVNDGPDLVNRPQGELYSPQYMSTCKRSGSLSFHGWGCISHRVEGQLDDLHYQNILQNVTMPSVWMLYPEVIIHLQQDHSSIHYSSSSLRNTPLTKDRYPCHRWDSNPQSQQARGRIPPGHWDRRNIAPTHRKWKVIL